MADDIYCVLPLDHAGDCATKSDLADETLPCPNRWGKCEACGDSDENSLDLMGPLRASFEAARARRLGTPTQEDQR